MKINDIVRITEGQHAGQVAKVATTPLPTPTHTRPVVTVRLTAGHPDPRLSRYVMLPADTLTLIEEATPAS